MLRSSRHASRRWSIRQLREGRVASGREASWGRYGQCHLARTSCRSQGTCVGLLVTGVGTLVPDKVALLGEAPWAHGASVGLLPGVRPLVRCNVALPGEAAWAHGASVVGLLPRVDPLVRRNGALLATRNNLTKFGAQT